MEMQTEMGLDFYVECMQFRAARSEKRQLPRGGCLERCGEAQ